MLYRNKTYVIFDGDCDRWAYAFMKGWKALPTVPFNFHDAHDLGPDVTDRASEDTVKRVLRQRFSSAKDVVVLIGRNTRNLYRYVRWELEVALQLDLPIVAVNLNDKRTIDHELCPPIIRDEYVVHVPFKLAIVRHALANFPAEHSRRSLGSSGARHYPENVYQDLGLLPSAVSPPPIRPVSPPPFRPASPSDHTLAGLLGYLSTPPPVRPPSVPPLRAYSLASLLSAAPVTPPSPPMLSLADLMNPIRNPPDPPSPWLKRPGK